MCKVTSCDPHYETHVELAIAVIKTHDRGLVHSLKNFLTLLPSPQCLEEILKLAICHLATTDPETCRWLWCNAACLEPELDLSHLEICMHCQNSCPS
jgi:hypothetical protein